MRGWGTHKIIGGNQYGVGAHHLTIGQNGITISTAMTEQQETILERLIEAFETDIALPVRVSPQFFGSSMPDYIHTPAENFAMAREDTAGGRRWKKDMEAEERRRTMRRAKCSRERISRMEEAFDWIRKYIWDEDARQVLLAYAEVKPADGSGAATSRRETGKTRRRAAWVKRTVQRWKFGLCR
jgi:hypothetical protein